MRHIAIAALCTVCWIIPNSIWGDEATPRDPQTLDALSPAPPAFQKALKPVDWEKQFKAASQQLGDLEALAKSDAPATGLLLASTNSRLQAGRLGLLVNEVIVALDDMPVDNEGFDDARKDVQQQLTVLGLDGKLRKVTVNPGKIGIGTLPWSRPELIYLRNGNRNAKWDAYVTVGAAQAKQNPDLAETAWSHAFDAGYPADGLSDYCGMTIASRQGRNDEAVMFGRHLFATHDYAEALKDPQTAYELAFANFKLAQGVEGWVEGQSIPERFGRSVSTLKKMREAFAALPDAQRVAPAPSEVSKFIKANALRSLRAYQSGNEAVDDFNRSVTRWMVNPGGNPLDMTTPTAHYRPVLQVPEVDLENVELDLNLRLSVTDAQDSGYQKEFNVGLVDCDTPESAAAGYPPVGTRILQISFLPGGTCAIHIGPRHREPDLLTSVYEETADNKPFTLRLLHCSGRNEIWINHRRLMYLPALENPKRIGFHLSSIGMAVKTRVDYWKLDPSSVAGQ